LMLYELRIFANSESVFQNNSFPYPPCVAFISISRSPSFIIHAGHSARGTTLLLSATATPFPISISRS
jgi:hypothetical protein